MISTFFRRCPCWITLTLAVCLLFNEDYAITFATVYSHVYSSIIDWIRWIKLFHFSQVSRDRRILFKREIYVSSFDNQIWWKKSFALLDIMRQEEESVSYEKENTNKKRNITRISTIVSITFVYVFCRFHVSFRLLFQLLYQSMERDFLVLHRISIIQR